MIKEEGTEVFFAIYQHHVLFLVVEDVGVLGDGGGW